MHKPNKGQSTRVEVRSLDAACNPYLAFAVLLGAGLKGIEEGYELPPETEDDVWSLTDGERRAMGIKPLPSSLGRALEVMEESELVAEILGEHVFDFFLRNKRRSGSTTATRSPASSSTATCPVSDGPPVSRVTHWHLAIRHRCHHAPAPPKGPWPG